MIAANDKEGEAYAIKFKKDSIQFIGIPAAHDQYHEKFNLEWYQKEKP